MDATLIPALAERRALAEQVLRDNPDASDRNIAKSNGLARGLVCKVRAELVGTGAIPADAFRLGRDNKRYPAARCGSGMAGARRPVLTAARRIAGIARSLESPAFKAAYAAAGLSERAALDAAAQKLRTAQFLLRLDRL